MGKRREKAAWERYGTRVTLQRVNNCGSKDKLSDVKILAINTVQEQKDKLLIKMKSNYDLNALL